MLGASEVGVRDQGTVVTPGPWLARDGVVSDVAYKLDRMLARLDRLEHEGSVVKHHVTELMDNARQASRFQAFAESLRNAREFKLETLQRSLKDVKARVELIEGPKSKQSTMTFKSLEPVDEKLKELEGRIATAERVMRVAIVMFAASAVMVAAAVATLFF